MKHVVGILISTTIALNAAAFNATDSYINVPIAKQFKLNEIQFGVSNAYNGSAAIQDEDARYEMDFKTVYSIHHRHQVALNLVNKNRFVGHYQYAISDRFSPYQIAAGLRNITESPYNSWNDSKYNDDINMSPYIVNTFYGNKTTFSIGYGIRAFNHKTKTLKGIGSFIENLNGLFLGVSYDETVMSFMAEYDGRDMNFGVKFKPSDNYAINIALTEQFIDSDFNPQHNGAPRRQITFGISTRNLFSHNDYFNKQIKELNLRIAELEERELKRADQQKKKIEVEIIKEDDALKAKVADLYSESLIKYNQRDYGASIKRLRDALKLDPENVTIMSRLGSVYYTYGFLDHAAFYWEKALQNNPNIPNKTNIETFLKKYRN